MNTERSRADGMAMEPCLYCGEPARSAVAALFLRLRGCACVACGGDGLVPGIVHDAWARGESGSAEWAEFWSAQPRWRQVLGV